MLLVGFQRQGLCIAPAILELPMWTKLASRILGLKAQCLFLICKLLLFLKNLQITKNITLLLPPSLKPLFMFFTSLCFLLIVQVLAERPWYTHVLRDGGTTQDLIRQAHPHCHVSVKNQTTRAITRT